MAAINTTLSEMTIREKVEFARCLAEAVPNYPGHFPSPPHTQVEVEAAARALEIAYNAARVAKMPASRKAEILRAPEMDLDIVLRQQITYVESASRDNCAVLRNLGLNRPLVLNAELASQLE